MRKFLIIFTELIFSVTLHNTHRMQPNQPQESMSADQGPSVRASRFLRFYQSGQAGFNQLFGILALTPNGEVQRC